MARLLSRKARRGAGRIPSQGGALRRALRGSACLAAALALAGCSLFSSDDDQRYAPVPLTDYEPGVSARIAWRTSVGSGSGVGFAPMVLDGAVYAAAADGSVAKYDLASGKPIWRHDVDADLSAGVGTDGRITAVATPQGEVIALDENGAEKWRARATSEVSIPPVVGGGVVVVRSGDYRIQAFNAETGERIWSVQRPGPALALRSPSQMVIAQGLVITGLPGGRLMAVNAANGNVQWEGTVSTPRGSSDLERVNDVVGAPQLAGRLLCAVAYQGRIVCFDVSSGGRPIWAKDFSSAAGMTVDGRFAFAPDQNSVMYGFALEGGGNIWKQDALRNRRLSAPAVADGVVAAGDLEGYVHFMSAQDGHLLGRVSLGGDPIVAPLVATPSGVIAQDSDGELALISVN